MTETDTNPPKPPENNGGQETEFRDTYKSRFVLVPPEGMTQEQLDNDPEANFYQHILNAASIAEDWFRSFGDLEDNNFERTNKISEQSAQIYDYFLSVDTIKADLLSNKITLNQANELLEQKEEGFLRAQNITDENREFNNLEITFANLSVDQVALSNLSHDVKNIGRSVFQDLNPQDLEYSASILQYAAFQNLTPRSEKDDPYAPLSIQDRVMTIEEVRHPRNITVGEIVEKFKAKHLIEQQMGNATKVDVKGYENQKISAICEFTFESTISQDELKDLTLELPESLLISLRENLIINAAEFYLLAYGDRVSDMSGDRPPDFQLTATTELLEDQGRKILHVTFTDNGKGVTERVDFEEGMSHPDKPGTGTAMWALSNGLGGEHYIDKRTDGEMGAVYHWFIEIPTESQPRDVLDDAMG